MKRNALILASVALSFLLLGCQRMKLGRSHSKSPAAQLSTVINLTPVPLTNELQMVWRQPMTNFYTLGPGDRLEIEVL